jgi:hypothetical protein
MDEQNIRSEDYINLAVFKKILIQILLAFFSVFRYIIKVIDKSKLLLIAGLIAGLVVGYSYYSTRAKYFEVSMIVRSGELTNKTMSEIIKQLNTLVTGGSKIKLSRELNISENEAREILFISSSTMTDETLDNDTSTKVHQPFKIIAQINDTDVTDKLQRVIITYLNEKPFLKKRKEDERKTYQDKLAYINSELADLDTLKKTYNHFLASGKISSTIYNNAINPADIYIQSNTLANQKAELLIWLSAESEAVSVIDEFKSTSAPQSYSLTKSLITSVLIFITGSFLLGLIMELNKTSKAYGKSG